MVWFVFHASPIHTNTHSHVLTEAKKQLAVCDKQIAKLEVGTPTPHRIIITTRARLFMHIDMG